MKRAVETAIKLKKENPDKNIYILGELIHNTDVINELEKMGIKTINEIPEQGDGIALLEAMVLHQKFLSKLKMPDLSLLI